MDTLLYVISTLSFAHLASGEECSTGHMIRIQPIMLLRQCME